MTKARDLANASTALSAVSATELGYLDGVTSAIQTQVDGKSATSHNHDSAYINQTTFDAKGDLIVGTADNTYSRLGAGSNGDTIVADSSTSTGLRYQQQNIKNYAYNSNFDIWQRGTSFASVSGYFADRWSNVGSYANVTASRQTSGAAVGSYYYLRHTATGAGAYWNNVQNFETQDCEELWGKTVTLSMKVRRNATANNGGLILTLDKSATVDAGSGASWSAIGTTNIALASIPTGTTSADWYTASLTVTVPSDGTANSLRINIAYNGGTASGTVFDFSQVMLQVGSVVTAYQRQNGTIQGELAACKRYYERRTAASTQGYAPYAAGYFNFATAAVYAYSFETEKRVQPTITLGPSINQFMAGYNGNQGQAAVTLTAGNISKFGCYLTLVPSGTPFTSGQATTLQDGGSAVSYIEVSAEL